MQDITEDQPIYVTFLSKNISESKGKYLCKENNNSVIDIDSSQ